MHGWLGVAAAPIPQQRIPLAERGCTAQAHGVRWPSVRCILLNACCCLSFRAIIKNKTCLFSVDIACLTIVSIIFIHCRGNTFWWRYSADNWPWLWMQLYCCPQLDYSHFPVNMLKCDGREIWEYVYNVNGYIVINIINSSIFDQFHKYRSFKDWISNILNTMEKYILPNIWIHG